jgi:phage terminase large subunit-like protein
MHAALAQSPTPAPAVSAFDKWPEPAWITRAADEHGYTWARIYWCRAASQDGAWFDHVKAQRVVDAWPRWMHFTDDRFAGKPFYLAPWQEIVVRLIVGWKVPIEITDEQTRLPIKLYVRLYRQLDIWIARKNGKTEFLAALGKLFFVHERVVGAQGFVFGKDENQGELLFDKLKAMVAYDAAAAKAVRQFRKSLYIPETRGLFKLLTGKPEGKHGRSPTIIIGDEMHEWLSRLLADTLRQGTGARLQPFEAYGSSAGLKTNPIGTELYEEALSVLDGRLEDATRLSIIFAVDPDDDPFDETNWPKANPNIGVSPTWHFLRREAANAKGNPRKEAQFRCYHLGQWIDAEVRWLPLTAWDACAPDKQGWKVRREKMRGHRCKVAFDVSSTQDITALIERFEEEDSDRVLLCARFWIPEESLAAREKAGRVPWRKWIEMGALEVTPGNAVDQDYVRQAIEEDLAMFEVEQIGFDPWNARKLVGDLTKAGAGADRGEDDALFVEIRQGILSLGEASKEFERRVFDGTLDHGGHPLLRWMAGHTVIRFDENLNFMPAKKRSRDKIDGIVAGVMTEALALTAPLPFRSAYEDHGLAEIEI